MHECSIGILNDYDDTRVVTIKDLKEEISLRLDLIESGFNMKNYSLNDYCDRRKSTDLTRFNFCPFCGKKIDFKTIKNENDKCITP